MGVDTERVASGTPGLDTVLDGGLVRGQTTVVNGGPGTGKTVLALQFLAAGDSGLYVGFEEREADLRRNAAGLGIDLDDVEILDLSADGERFFEGDEYTLFPAEEVEGEDLIDEMAAAIDGVEPDRLVIDPLSELQAILPDSYRFRRNISSLVNEMKARGTTTLCTAQAGEGADRDLQFLGDATVEIRRTTDDRWLEVTKFRGSGFAKGRHTYRIRGGTGGHVYPKLVPGDHSRDHDRTQLRSGTAELDSLLGGGIGRGSVTVVSGPSGVGKTTVCSLFLAAAAGDGVSSQCYLFEELRDDYLYRCDRLGIPVSERCTEGDLRISEVESLEQSVDEFAHDVRVAVEEEGVELVMLDGIPGYRLGLSGGGSADDITRELHALCRYLKRMGVTVLLVDEVRNVTGDLTATDQQISYLADNIVFLRYMEVDGSIEKAIGVLKKRFGDFEQSLRGLDITEGGVRVGDRLTGMRGVLTGIPERVDRG